MYCQSPPKLTRQETVLHINIDNSNLDTNNNELQQETTFDWINYLRCLTVLTLLLIVIIIVLIINI